MPRKHKPKSGHDPRHDFPRDYANGVAAVKANIPENQAPHAKGTPQYEAWMAGRKSVTD